MTSKDNEDNEKDYVMNGDDNDYPEMQFTEEEEEHQQTSEVAPRMSVSPEALEKLSRAAQILKELGAERPSLWTQEFLPRIAQEYCEKDLEWWNQFVQSYDTISKQLAENGSYQPKTVAQALALHSVLDFAIEEEDQRVHWGNDLEDEDVEMSVDQIESFRDQIYQGKMLSSLGIDVLQMHESSVSVEEVDETSILHPRNWFQELC
eukprot:TRINITY_DN99_c0_g1_i1.p1 TRINITY_DN99_c0_g1~~TRINITY_DN99_c0_g1_i1.p1  ORF type:complete len:238 (+),score=76.70 TRINITY_DN99_c0_g1_i1:97-714(+)